MLDLKNFIDILIAKGYGPFLCVPCSNFKNLIDYLLKKYPEQYIITNNEGEAISIACGMFLANKKPIIMCQNSGLGNMLDPLTSLIDIYNIHILLIVSWRGKKGLNDEKQHEKMGSITEQLLSLLNIDYIDSSVGLDIIEQNLPNSNLLNDVKCILIDKETFVAEQVYQYSTDSSTDQVLLSKKDVIELVCKHVDDNTFIISTNGYISRELYAVKDRLMNFYMYGSMGCASSIALGYSMVKNLDNTVVLDGDGSILMRMEALVSIGHYQPSHFIHILLDDGQYASTGGQPTLSSTVDFNKIALAVGYKYVFEIRDILSLQHTMLKAQSIKGPVFIRAFINKTIEIKKRPTISPEDITKKFINR